MYFESCVYRFPSERLYRGRDVLVVCVCAVDQTMPIVINRAWVSSCLASLSVAVLFEMRLGEL